MPDEVRRDAVAELVAEMKGAVERLTARVAELEAENLALRKALLEEMEGEDGR